MSPPHWSIVETETQSQIALLLGAQNGVEIVTSDQRQRITEFYRRYYHHAAPFLPEVLDRFDGRRVEVLHAVIP